MNLRTLRALHPHLFYAQDWFEQEAFMLTEGHGAIPRDILILGLGNLGLPERRQGLDHLRPAIDWAMGYVTQPALPVWQRYLWTSDFDHLGQRVYIGCNDQGLEIHRHIHLSERFGVPIL